MRKHVSRHLVAVLATSLGLLGVATPILGAPQTVTGTLIDLYCYGQRQEDTGMDHGNNRECAWACVKYTGMPVGVLTSDGRVYELAGPVVANNNAQIAEHVTKRVRVVGEVSLRDGMPTITTDRVTVLPEP